MTDRPDTEQAKELIEKEMMWENDTQDELDALDRLTNHLRRIGIDL